MKYSSYLKFDTKRISGNKSRMRFMSILVLSLAILFSVNLAIGAEGISAPIKKPPVISKKTGGASNLAKSLAKQKKIGEAPSNATTQETKAVKEQSPFFKRMLSMFRALFAVLALIGGLAGAVLFYRWFKNKAAMVEAQQQAIQAVKESKEPETVSEAVASFVKHRIKK